MNPGISEQTFSPPDRVSVRGRVLVRVVESVARRWPRQDPAKLARRARKFFDLPNVLGLALSRGLQIERVQDGSVCGEWIAMSGRAAETPVLLFLHGGGYVSCSSKSHRPITTTLARLLPARIFSLDYRLAPEHPFPAAVDDAATAYRWLIGKGVLPQQIALAGDSAGGGLVMATLLRLQREKIVLPACAVCFSPWVDLTGACASAEKSPTFESDEIALFADLYLCGIHPEHPEASPVFADLTGLPPLLIQASRTELLADDAIRLHARAKQCGVASTLTVYPELPHVWQIYAGLIPEARLALQQAANFVLANWRKGSPTWEESDTAIRHQTRSPDRV